VAKGRAPLLDGRRGQLTRRCLNPGSDMYPLDGGDRPHADARAPGQEFLRTPVVRPAVCGLLMLVFLPRSLARYHETFRAVRACRRRIRGSAPTREVGLGGQISVSSTPGSRSGRFSCENVIAFGSTSLGPEGSVGTVSCHSGWWTRASADGSTRPMKAETGSAPKNFALPDW
jgi:hypothetical protein